MSTVDICVKFYLIGQLADQIYSKPHRRVYFSHNSFNIGLGQNFFDPLPFVRHRDLDGIIAIMKHNINLGTRAPLVAVLHRANRRLCDDGL